MAWVLNKLGPSALIYPGQQQHARAAIQWLSGQIHQERVFTHLGWRKQGADWVYLHSGGALEQIHRLPEFRCRFPWPFRITRSPNRPIQTLVPEQSVTACAFSGLRQIGLPSRCWPACTVPLQEGLLLALF